jgi:hypothetical protein
MPFHDRAFMDPFANIRKFEFICDINTFELEPGCLEYAF